ncbi:MAG: hypothetical protein LBO06_02000 [Bacteroidales bacterium]|nr:hypothetical protein [Bacteroidales bacterium]
MQKLTIRILLAIMLVASSLWQSATAQTAVSSPYSRYGIGSTNIFSDAVKSSIGGVGYAFSRNNMVNLKNPAALSGIDTMSFVFDVGFHADFLSFTSSTAKSSGMSGALSHISMAFPINKHLKMAISLLPLSDINYETSEIVQVTDTTFYRNRYNGTGGLNKAIVGLSYNWDKTNDKFALGANVEYMFGSYYKSSAIIFYDNTDTLFRSSDPDHPRYSVDSTLFNCRDEIRYNIQNFNINLGFQYFHTLNNGSKVGIGGSYVLPLTLKTKNIRQRYTFISNNGLETHKDMVIDSSYNGKIKFPTSFGFGLSYEKPQKFFIGADAQFTQWSEFRLQTDGYNDPLQDSWNIGVGGEFTPDVYGSYIKQMTYRLGLNYDNGSLCFDNDINGRPYISSQGTRLSQYSVAVGFGLPVKKSTTLINLSFEYGKRGTIDNSLIRENFFRIGFSLSAKDRWFFKRKYQ